MHSTHLSGSRLTPGCTNHSPCYLSSPNTLKSMTSSSVSLSLSRWSLKETRPLPVRLCCRNYNAANPTLPDKRSIENSTGSVSGKVTATLFCGIECANDKTAYGGIKYVRTVDIDSAGRRMYDLGFMQIAASGVPAGLAIGELWCRYRVRLSKMKVGALKVVPMSDGLTLQQLPPDGQVVSSNPFFMNETADFTRC